jgi:hypothetical protein
MVYKRGMSVMGILRPCRIWVLATVIWIGYTTFAAILDYDHILRDYPRWG